jgi:PEP-CTERM motif
VKRATGLLVGALVILLGSVANVTAAGVSGNFSYAITGETSQPGCQSLYGGNPWTDNFSGSGTDSLNTPDTDSVTFGICDGIAGLLEGGTFTVSDGANTLSGIFSGTLVGTSEIGEPDVFDGSFSVTSSTGDFAVAGVSQGDFEVVTGDVGSAQFATGTFDFQSTPEPATTILFGTGLILVCLLRRASTGTRGFSFNRVR